MAIPVERPPGPVLAWTDERITRLVQRQQRPLAAYLAALGCPRGQIQDLVQDGFLALLRARFEERSAGSTAAYLRRTVRNAYFKWLREPPEALDVEALEAAWSEYDGDDGGESYVEALRACLQGRPARDHEALRLRYGQDLPRAEIGRRLELSEGGVKSVLLLCKQRLRACIERRLR